MDFKKNINYFTKTDLSKNIGIALMILGVLLLIFGWSYLSFLMMSVSIPAGLVMFLIGSSCRAGEKDLDAAIERAISNPEPSEEDAAKLKRQALKKIPPILACGYELREGLMLKKDKSGTTRSSEYTKAYLMPLEDALYVSIRSVSLIDSNKRECSTQIPYRDIKQISLIQSEVEIPFQKKLFRVKDCRFSITYQTGGQLSVPIRDDIISEQFAADLQAQIDKAIPSEG